MSYRAIGHKIIIICDTSDIGLIALSDARFKNLIKEQIRDKIRMCIIDPNFDDSKNRCHLDLIGSLYTLFANTFDVNIHLHYYSVFYAASIMLRNGGSLERGNGGNNLSLRGGLAITYEP